MKKIQKTILLNPDGTLAEANPDGEEINANLPAPIEKIVETEEEVIVGYEKEQTFKTVNYKGLIPILVGAVNEQQALIKELQTQLQEQMEMNKKQQTQINQLLKK